MRRRSIGERRRCRSSIRLRTRSTGCCRSDPKLPGRARPRAARAAWLHGSKTIVDDYLREVGRCSRRSRRTFQRTVYRPGRGLPVRRLGAQERGPGRSRSDAQGVASWSRAWATRARARARWSSASRLPTCSPGSRAACGGWAALPQALVWDRQAGIHAHGGRPSEEFAALCGRLRVDWHVLRAAPTRRPRASSSACRAMPRRTSSPAAASPTRSTSKTQLDAWFDEGQRPHAQDAARPTRSIASLEELRGDGAAARRRARHGPALGAPGAARPVSCASTPATTRSTRRSSVAALRRASPIARSSRSRWTPASSPAAIRAASPSTARSPRSSTPAR